MEYEEFVDLFEDLEKSLSKGYVVNLSKLISFIEANPSAIHHVVDRLDSFVVFTQNDAAIRSMVKCGAQKENAEWFDQMLACLIDETATDSHTPLKELFAISARSKVFAQLIQRNDDDLYLEWTRHAIGTHREDIQLFHQIFKELESTSNIVPALIASRVHELKKTKLQDLIELMSKTCPNNFFQIVEYINSRSGLALSLAGSLQSSTSTSAQAESLLRQEFEQLSSEQLYALLLQYHSVADDSQTKNAVFKLKKILNIDENFVAFLFKKCTDLDQTLVREICDRALSSGSPEGINSLCSVNPSLVSLHKDVFISYCMRYQFDFALRPLLKEDLLDVHELKAMSYLATDSGDSAFIFLWMSKCQSYLEEWLEGLAPSMYSSSFKMMYDRHNCVDPSENLKIFEKVLHHDLKLHHGKVSIDEIEALLETKIPINDDWIYNLTETDKRLLQILNTVTTDNSLLVKSFRNEAVRSSIKLGLELSEDVLRGLVEPRPSDTTRRI